MLDALLWVLAGLCEAAGGWLLFTGWPWLALLAHALCAMAATAAAWLILPPHYHRGLRRAVVYPFVFAFCVPVFGPLGLLVSVLPALYFGRAEPEKDWRDLDQLDLPYKPVELATDIVYLDTGVRRALLIDDVETRVRALRATRNMSGRRAVPILKIALQDPVDEVRLLAYALVDGKLQRIEQGVQALRKELEAHPGDSRFQAKCEEAIAELYCEEAELGLVEGEVRQQALLQALKAIDVALGVSDTPVRQYLRGRIQLRLGRVEAAAQALHRAEASGLAADRIAPYLAECAFMRRDVGGVRRELARISDSLRQTPVLRAVTEYWS